MSPGFPFCKMEMKLPTLSRMNGKTKWDVTCGNVLWAIQCKDSAEAVTFGLDIFVLLVVVMGDRATKGTEDICVML